MDIVGTGEPRARSDHRSRAASAPRSPIRTSITQSMARTYGVYRPRTDHESEERRAGAIKRAIEVVKRGEPALIDTVTHLARRALRLRQTSQGYQHEKTGSRRLLSNARGDCTCAKRHPSTEMPTMASAFPQERLLRLPRLRRPWRRGRNRLPAIATVASWTIAGIRQPSGMPIFTAESSLGLRSRRTLWAYLKSIPEPPALKDIRILNQ